MAETVGSVALKIGLDMTSLDSGLRSAEASVRRFAEDGRNNLNKVAAGAIAAGAAAVTAGAGIAAGLYVKGAQAIDVQAKLAQQLNTTSAAVAVLTRAGDLTGVSIEKISAASRQLDINLGKAAQGGNAQADALARLGLNASQLAQMPLDQRFLKINEAIKANIPLVEQAAAGAEIFGAKNAKAISLIDSATLGRAAEEARLFGLAISDIDAAKVEQANDAFSTVGVAVQGLSQQIAIQAAPAVQAVADLLFESAKEAGGFGSVAETAMDKVVKAVSFVIDAVDGIKRVFSVVADGIIIGVNQLAGELGSIVYELLATFDKIPGVDLTAQMESVATFSNEAFAVVNTAIDNIDETLNRPLAGGVFRDMVEQAKVASEEVARQSVAARVAIAEAAPPAAAPVDQAAQDQIAAKIEALRAASLTETEIRDAKYASDLEALALYREQELLTNQQYDSIALGLAQNYANEKLAIAQTAAKSQQAMEQAAAQARTTILTGALNSMTTLMNSHSRKMFEVGKAAAISQSLISTYQGMAKALELGFPVGLAAAAAIGVAGFAQVKNISSQKFGGGGGAAGSVTQQVNAGSTPTGGGGGGGGAPAGPASGQTLTVTPVDPGAIFSGSTVNGLASTLAAFTKDGGKVVMGR